MYSMSVSQREWERNPSTGCQNGAPDRLVITTTQLWGCLDDWVYSGRLAARFFWVLGFTTQDGRGATHHFGHRQKSPRKRSLFLHLFTPSVPPAPELENFLLQIKTGPFPFLSQAHSTPPRPSPHSIPTPF